MQNPRNLIILFPDQLRADALGFLGNPVCRTPNLDRLAARSVVFERHFTTFPKCVPARASLMTGRYAHTHGWRTVQQVMDEWQPNLLRNFQDAGYQTAVFGKNHCWHSCDWDRLTFHSEHPALVDLLNPKRAKQPIDFDGPGRTPARLGPEWDYLGNGTRHRPDEAFTDQSVRFLRELRDPARPFFLQLNWESPHTEYGVEEPWFSLYDRDKLPPVPYSLPENPSLCVRAQRMWRTGLDDDPAAAREVQATYYGMVSKVDYLCGQILDTLDALDLWKDTVVVFASDHGDYAGQYGLPEKFDTHFSDCLMQTPLTFAAPGLPAGRRIGGLCSLAAIAPTLCELLDMAPLPGMHEASLLPVIHGAPAPTAVFATGGHEPGMRRRYTEFPYNRERFTKNPNLRNKAAPYYHEPDCMARAQMIRTDAHKLVISESGRHEFYDLAADPFEMCNLWGRPEIHHHVTPMLEQLVAWNIRTSTDQPFLDQFTV